MINPYTLAELVAGRRIPWKRIDDAPALLEAILQTPYEELSTRSSTRRCTSGSG